MGRRSGESEWLNESTWFKRPPVDICEASEHLRDLLLGVPEACSCSGRLSSTSGPELDLLLFRRFPPIHAAPPAEARPGPPSSFCV